MFMSVYLHNMDNYKESLKERLRKKNIKKTSNNIYYDPNWSLKKKIIVK